MYHQGERKTYNREFQEAATQRRAANDTQFFWDLVKRQMSGMGNMYAKRVNKVQEEKTLFTKPVEVEQPVGSIDDNIPVQRSGPKADEVDILETFSDLKDQVPSYVIRCIEMMKFERPTPIQKHAIPLGLAGLDLMCCAQTGSGKTFAFMVPLVSVLDSICKEPTEEDRRFAVGQDEGEGQHKGNSVRIKVDPRGAMPIAVVLAPTRELASQIHLDARRLTFGSTTRSVCVYGGNDIRAQLSELSLGCDIVIATPGRLNDLVDRGVVSLSQVSNLILDEGDRMLDMGFEPQIRKIVQGYDMPSTQERQTFLFSATFPNEIQVLAREFLREYVWIAVGRVGSTVDNIKQQIMQASSEPTDKISLLLSVLDQSNGRTLIFVQKRRTATWLCESLRGMYGITAEEIHGDRSQSQRENALRQFRDGSVRILVATDVAARGLDIPAVMHVIQFDMPISAEDFDVYVHRIGRTGRAGMSGLATSFFVPGREIGEGNGKIAPMLVNMLKETNQGNSMQRRGGGGRGQNSRFMYQDHRNNQKPTTYYNNYAPNEPSFDSRQQNNFNAYGGSAVDSTATSAAPRSNYSYGANQKGNVGNYMQQQAQPQSYQSQSVHTSQMGRSNFTTAPTTAVASVAPAVTNMYQNMSLQQSSTNTSLPYQTSSMGQHTAVPGMYPTTVTEGYYDPYLGSYVPATAPVAQADMMTQQFQAYSMPQQQSAQQVVAGNTWAMQGTQNTSYMSVPVQNANYDRRKQYMQNQNTNCYYGNAPGYASMSRDFSASAQTSQHGMQGNFTQRNAIGYTSSYPANNMRYGVEQQTGNYPAYANSLVYDRSSSQYYKPEAQAYGEYAQQPSVGMNNSSQEPYEGRGNEYIGSENDVTGQGEDGNAQSTDV